MAQLKDLLVAGPSRLIGDTYTTNLQVKTLLAPSTSGGTAYGAGTSGQVLMSNGTSSYWGTASSISGMNNYVTLDGAQTITGNKTFSGTATFSNTVTISGANKFTYSGFSAGTDNKDRVVWFSYANNNNPGNQGTPVYDNDFKYNPSTNNLTVGKINGFTLATETVGSASAGTAIAADDITAWSAGSAPTLGTAIKAYTSLNTGASASVTAGTAASLSYTARSVGSASGWSAGTASSTSYSNGVLSFTNSTTPSLTISSVACDDITAWTTNTPTAVTANTVVTGGTTTDVPNVTNVGSAPSLTYTARSIPNISVTSKTVLKSTT